MTIEIHSPELAALIRKRLESGAFQNVEDVLMQALRASPLPPGKDAEPAAGTVFEKGLGLFGSPEDAALLDEVVSLAYQERRRPSKRGLTF